MPNEPWFSIRASGRRNLLALSYELATYFKYSIHVRSPNKKAKIKWCLFFVQTLQNAGNAFYKAQISKFVQEGGGGGVHAPGAP